MTNKKNSLVTTIFSFESPAQFPSTLEFDHSALHENRQPPITLSRRSNGSLHISCKTLIRDYQKSSDKFRQQQWMESMEYAISMRNLLARGLHYPGIDLPPNTGKDFPEDEPPPTVRLTIFQRCACLKFEDKEIQLVLKPRRPNSK